MGAVFGTVCDLRTGTDVLPLHHVPLKWNVMGEGELEEIYREMRIG